MTEKQSFWSVLIGGFIGNLCLVGIGVSCYFFFIQPTFASLTNTNNELALLEKREAILQTADREIKQRADDLRAINAAFLNLENAVPFVTLLETMAAEHNVTISIKTDSPASSATVEQVEFNITITGTFAHTMRFIKQAESIPYFSDIASIHISTKNNQVEALLRLLVLTL